MNPKKPEVMRNATDVAEYELPEWDKQGNRLSPKKPIVTKPQAEPEPASEELTEADISAPTVKELAEIREQAYNEGFEQGYEEGLKQGKVAGAIEGKQQGHTEGLLKGAEQGAAQAEQKADLAYEKQRQETFAVFVEAVAELKIYRQNDQKELETALATLAIRLAKQVIQDELVLQPKHIIPVVHATVESLPNPDDSLTISLHPLDLAIIAEVADSHWQLQPNESITRGGCTLKSGFSYVDYTLEHRFETAIRSLLHHIETPKETAQWLKPLSNEPLISDAEPELEVEPEPEPALKPEPKLEPELEAEPEQVTEAAASEEQVDGKSE